MDRLNCFKAYDIRGKVPSELNSELAYKIGRAYSKLIDAETVVIGHDIRKSSEAISEALKRGFNDCGVDVIDIGLCGTEMVYYAVPALEADGGIMITASHNPPEYNGMKFVKKNSVPVGYDSGLNEIERMIFQDEIKDHSDYPGDTKFHNVMSGFIANLKKFYSPDLLKPFKVVTNAGNGCAGLAINALEKHLPVNLIKIHNEPNSDFPHGVPNPLLVENRKTTIDAVLNNHADLGVAWDGDYDRCFFFDEKGNFIEGYYIVALLAKSILKKHPGENIIHDPRLVWNTLDVVQNSGGRAV